MKVKSFSEGMMHLHMFPPFSKGQNFCDLLFASLDNETLSRRGQHLKERICS